MSAGPRAYSGASVVLGHLEAITKVIKLSRIAWSGNSALMALAALSRTAMALIPIVQLWIPKLILDELVRCAGQSRITRKLFTLLIWQLLFAIAADILSRSIIALDGLVAESSSRSINEKIMKHASTLDVSQFESPSLYDKLERARTNVGSRVSLLLSLATMGQEAVTLGSLMLGFAAISHWLFMIMIVSVVPAWFHERTFSRQRHALNTELVPVRRLLDYLMWLVTTLGCMVEVKVYGIGEYLTTEYRRGANVIYRRVRDLARRKIIKGCLASIASIACAYSVYVLTITRILRGSLSLGTFVFIVGSFARASTSVGRIATCLNSVAENSLLLVDLFEFFELKPTIQCNPASLKFPADIVTGFEFKNVSFAYPGQEKLVLTNLSFSIRPGETIALAGENGCGKTTVIKLLMRLYDPVAGCILLEGIDLRNYDPLSLQRSIGILCQDFVRYDMPVRENIGFGNLDRMGHDDALRMAAEAGRCRDIIERFPRQYTQMLGRRFEGGIGLSGGEWQRVALARAWMREAPLMIFDEPSASLDPRGEHEMFQRFYALTRGKMAVLISHRMPTVRLADRIIVLVGGAPAEEGTHEELLELNGTYAQLYTLQAKGFAQRSVNCD
jgi:ATP-binding cassette, subfamily B, bacterial